VARQVKQQDDGENCYGDRYQFFGYRYLHWLDRTE
jgi:hypothetical protein